MGELMMPKVEKNEKENLSGYGLSFVRRFREEKGNVSIAEYEKEGINWQHLLESQEKSFLEIAGPSLQSNGNDIIDFSDYKEKLICSNVESDFQVKNRDGRLVDAKEYLDVVTDATALSFAEGSLGAVFVKNFRMAEDKRTRPKPDNGQFDRENTECIRKVGAEVWRVLDDGGLLVWLNFEKPDFLALRDKGFEPIFYQERKYENISEKRYQAVFVKSRNIPRNQ